ncbi:MAG: hypothetical protein AB7O62_00185 [Pirellulales bacterium]
MTPAHGRPAENRSAIRADWWNAIRHWPMRGESKLAWWYLAGLTRCGLERVTVTNSMIGADQGTSDAAGNRALQNLIAEGLVEVIDQPGDRDALGRRKASRQLIELIDPFEAVRAKPLAWDGQKLLSFAEQEVAADLSREPADGPATQASVRGEWVTNVAVPSTETSTETSTEPRRAPLTLNPSSATTLSLSLSPDFLDSRIAHKRAALGLGAKEKGAAAGVDGSADGTATAGRPGQQLAEPPPRQSLAARKALADREVAELHAAINCPSMFLEPCETVVQAVLNEELPEKVVHSVLRWLDKKQAAGCRDPRSQLFNGRMKLEFKRRGLIYSGKPKPR